MAADERNQSSGGFEVLAMLVGVIAGVILIAWPLWLLFKFVLLPFAFELSAFVLEVVESVSP